MGIKVFMKTYLHSFQFRVFLAMALVIFIFIPGTGYVGYLQARKVAEQQMQQYAIGTAEQIAERVRTYLSQHSSNVKLIKSFLENQLMDSSDEMELLRYFQLFKQDHPEFVNIYYGSETGRFLMFPPQSPEVHKTFDPRNRPWYSGAVTADSLHWTDVYLFASTQKPGITVSIPVFEEQNMLRGVCGIDIDLSTFSRFLQGIEVGKKGYAYIFENEQGRVIAHPGLVQLPWSPGHIELLRSCLVNLKREGVQFGLTNFYGEDFFTAYTDYPGKEWTVGVTLSISDFFDNIHSIKKATFSLVLVGILICSLISYLLAMTIIRPLKALQQGIERISSGDLKHQVDIRDPDIARDLAGSFNRMAASLGASEKELKYTYGELAKKEKLAAVGQMTAGIAHEIKNPLGIMLGSAQVVVNRERSWKMRERAANFIIHEVIRLNKTLESFLAFAKPALPVFEKTDMVALLAETLSASEERYKEMGFRFERSFPEAVPPIRADADQIRQIFWNLFLNAVQAMPEGGIITLGIRVEKTETTMGSLSRIIPPASPGEDRLVVSIGDSGCGITDEQMEKIFDPFVSFRDNGSGLGLSIVAQIVDLHRGHININSKQGDGTEFLLSFPCERQEC